MKALWNRVLGLLLALLLCLGALPLTPQAQEPEEGDGLIAMNIFGAGTNLIGRSYLMARYDSRLEGLLDEDGRPDFESFEDGIRYRKAGKMLQAANLQGSRMREYYFLESGVYDIAFYSQKQLDARRMRLLGSAYVSGSFTERVYGEGDYALYVYFASLWVPEEDCTATLYLDGTEAVQLVLTHISVTGSWPTSCEVTGYREASDGVLSALRLRLTGFNLPGEAGAYSLRDEDSGALLAEAAEVEGSGGEATLLFRFDGGMDSGLLSWPNLYIDGALSFYYAPEEERDWRYESYGFVQIPSVYSGVCETGLTGVNLTNAGATNIESFPVFSGQYMDYPPDGRIGSYMGLGMPLLAAYQADWIRDGMASPAYFLAASDGATVHELYLYGTEELEPSRLGVVGAELTEPFTCSVFGDGNGTLYTYRAVVSIPAEGELLGVDYRDAPLASFPVHRVENFQDARIPRDYDPYEDPFHLPSQWSETPAPLVCTCWTEDFQLDGDGVISSFDLAFSGFNLPADYSDYRLFCYEAEQELEAARDSGEAYDAADYVFAQASSLRVDEYGKTVVTFQVRNPRYAGCTTYPIFYRMDTENHYTDMKYFSYYSSIYSEGNELMNYNVYEGHDGKWYITEALRDYGLFYGVTLRAFSPYNVLGKDYDALFGKALDFDWTGDDTVTVSAYITSDVFRWGWDEEDPPSVTVLLAAYDEAGRLLSVNSEVLHAPGRVSLSTDAAGAASASLFCLDSLLSPIKTKQSAAPDDRT